MLFLLVSNTSVQCVLNPQHHLPPTLVRGESSIWMENSLIWYKGEGEGRSQAPMFYSPNLGMKTRWGLGRLNMITIFFFLIDKI